MPRQILYAYVNGADLDDVAATLEERFARFVATRQWICSSASVVNQRRGEETCTQPGDSSLWDLGVNLPLPDAGAEPPDWFADVEAIARHLGRLHRETGREFVIGIAEAETGITEDLFYVSSDTPDLERLRNTFGL